MKVFLCVAVIAVIAGLATANPTGLHPIPANIEMDNNDQDQLLQLGSDLNRYRKSYGSGGGHSMPSPACPKNYMFACQPHLSPVPCASSSGASYSSHGSSGAYTAPVPAYAAPVAYSFNGLLPQYYQN